MSLRAKVPPPPAPPSADPLMTVKRLAQREGVSERHVRRMIERGLPAYKAVGVRIRLSEYERWLEAHRRPASPDRVSRSAPTIGADDRRLAPARQKHAVTRSCGDDGDRS